MLSNSRRAQFQRYRGDSDIVNELLTALEAQEKVLADILEQCEGLLDSSKWDNTSPGVVLAVYIVKVIKSEQQL